MTKPGRQEIALVVAIIAGLILGKLIKNYKIAFLVVFILGILLAFSFKRRK